MENIREWRGTFSMRGIATYIILYSISTYFLYNLSHN